MCFGTTTTWQMTGISNAGLEMTIATLDNGLEEEKEVRLRLGVNNTK